MASDHDTEDTGNDQYVTQQPGAEGASPPAPADAVVAIEPEVVKPDGRLLYPLDLAPSRALVIHCGDPRFQTAFRRFVIEELGHRQYTPVIIGGGAHAFGVQSFLPKNYKILWEQIKFFVKESGLREIIVINHEDCKWYEKMRGYHPRIGLPLKGRLDLESAAHAILKDFAHVRVRTFWAGLEGSNVVFTETSPK